MNFEKGECWHWGRDQTVC